MAPAVSWWHRAGTRGHQEGLWEPARALGQLLLAEPPFCKDTELMRPKAVLDVSSLSFLSLSSFSPLSKEIISLFFSFRTMEVVGTGQGCCPHGLPAPLRSPVPSTNPPGQGQDLWIHTFLTQKHLLISVFSASSPC